MREWRSLWASLTNYQHDILTAISWKLCVGRTQSCSIFMQHARTSCDYGHCYSNASPLSSLHSIRKSTVSSVVIPSTRIFPSIENMKKMMLTSPFTAVTVHKMPCLSGKRHRCPLRFIEMRCQFKKPRRIDLRHISHVVVASVILLHRMKDNARWWTSC